MSTPTPHTDVDLRPPGEDPAKDSAKDSASPQPGSRPRRRNPWTPSAGRSVPTDRRYDPRPETTLDATWRIRQLGKVSRWLTRAPATLEEYRTSFEDAANLAKRSSSRSTAKSSVT